MKQRRFHAFVEEKLETPLTSDNLNFIIGTPSIVNSIFIHLNGVYQIQLTKAGNVNFLAIGTKVFFIIDENRWDVTEEDQKNVIEKFYKLF